MKMTGTIIYVEHNVSVFCSTWEFIFMLERNKTWRALLLCGLTNQLISLIN